MNRHTLSNIVLRIYIFRVRTLPLHNVETNIPPAELRHRSECAYVINIYSTQIQQMQIGNIHIVEADNIF